MINSQGNVVHCGLDVSKKTLDVFAQSKHLHIQNDPQGHRQLKDWLREQTPQPHVVCEATGGYERKVVQTLHRAQIPVSVISPSRPRQLARSMGWLAKTDRKDAELLAFYGEKIPLKITSPTSENQRKLIELVSYQKQLKNQLVALVNQHEHLELTPASQSAQRIMNVLKRELQHIEHHIREHIETVAHLKEKKEKLTRIKGVGETTAHTLMAHLPELGGDINRGQLAALVGVAPYNRDSGQRHGKPSIYGGRHHVRAALYMASLSAARCNPYFKKYYQRLRQNGKPAKVALTAVMRKLLIILNASLKYPNFILAN